MTPDYKHVGGRGGDAAPRPRARGGWPVFLAGFALGLGVAVATHLYHVSRHGSVAPPVAVLNEPAPVSDVNDEEVHDDFFKILAEMEIVVPDYREADDAPRPSYVLQAGSFRERRTAQFLQEQLKALDLESEVQEVEVDDGSVWYRVRLGPYDRLSRVNNIRLDLRKRGIESMLKKR